MVWQGARPLPATAESIATHPAVAVAAAAASLPWPFLCYRGDSSTLEDFKLPYCHSGPADCSDLLSAVQTLRPTVLIGADQLGGQPPFAFDQHVVGTMADNAQHPLIFPLTSTQPECSPHDAYVWSGGRAILATCMQSKMVSGVGEGDGKVLQPSQITSTYIFPGIGECQLSCCWWWCWLAGATVLFHQHAVCCQTLYTCALTLPYIAHTWL